MKSAYAVRSRSPVPSTSSASRPLHAATFVSIRASRASTAITRNGTRTPAAAWYAVASLNVNARGEKLVRHKKSPGGMVPGLSSHMGVTAGLRRTPDEEPGTREHINHSGALSMSDSPDFRVSTQFLNHPKTRRLRLRHGAQGVLSLIQLWAFTRTHRPKGILHGMDREDLAAIAEAETPEVVDTLVELGFLELDGGAYTIHGWREHNGWAYFSDERREKGRRAAKARWNPEENDAKSKT